MSTFQTIKLPTPETIYQGATFRTPWLELSWFPYPTEWRNGVLINLNTGEEAPEVDRILEDYTDCEARMQIRTSVDAQDVIIDLTTQNGGIELDGAKHRLFIHHDDTETIANVIDWETAMGQMEVVRPDTTVERQFEYRFVLSRESTK